VVGLAGRGAASYFVRREAARHAEYKGSGPGGVSAANGLCVGTNRRFSVDEPPGGQLNGVFGMGGVAGRVPAPTI